MLRSGASKLQMLVQNMMETAPEISLVVDACHRDGQHERLDALLTQLEMCEKALQVTYRVLKILSFLHDNTN